MKTSKLKSFIRIVLKEVSQSNIKSRHARRSGFDKDWTPNLKMMTLDNLKAMREKSKRSIDFGTRDRESGVDVAAETKLFKMYDMEIKKRLQYINKPLEENKELGYNHNSTSDTRSIPSVRDELNDPRLNQKLHEGNFKYDDYKWMASGDGFNIPTDVYHGTILLGVIISKPDGYVIKKVMGPTKDKDEVIKDSRSNKFKSKDLAAETLHNVWKMLRSNSDETEKV